MRLSLYSLNLLVEPPVLLSSGELEPGLDLVDSNFEAETDTLRKESLLRRFDIFLALSGSSLPCK